MISLRLSDFFSEVIVKIDVKLSLRIEKDKHIMKALV